jgi:hypothetical protein
MGIMLVYYTRIFPHLHLILYIYIYIPILSNSVELLKSIVFRLLQFVVE